MSDLEKAIDRMIKRDQISSKTKLLYDDLPFDKQVKIETMLGQAINYCVLFHDDDDLDNFLSAPSDDRKFEILVKKAAEKLDISEQQIQSRLEEIYKYLYDKYYIDGYVFHTTNSVAAEQIRKDGLGTANRLWNDDEIIRINELYEQHGVKAATGWGYADIKSGKQSSWFFDITPLHITSYTQSPEWFSQLCGHAFMYHGVVPQKDRYAYINRDYETALRNISVVQKEHGFTEEESAEVINLFNKYWKVFEHSTQVLIMIPKKAVFDYPSFEKEKEDFENGEVPFATEDTFLAYMKRCLMTDIIECRDDKNLSENEKVSPDQLVFIDISPLFEKRKAKEKQQSGVQCEVVLGKHEPIEYESEAAKYFADMTGQDDMYFFKFKYSDYEAPIVAQITKLVEKMGRPCIDPKAKEEDKPKVFKPYCINKNGEATISSFLITGGFYCKPEKFDYVINQLSQIDGIHITGIENEDKMVNSQTDSPEKTENNGNEEFGKQDLMAMLRGLKPEDRALAKEIIARLTRGDLSIDEVPRNSDE